MGPTGQLEAEDGVGGTTGFRSNASGGQTRQLDTGETLTLSFDSQVQGEYFVTVRYSNDNSGPLEQVTVSVDGIEVGSFDAQDTGDFGAGWNTFAASPSFGPLTLEVGLHEVVISVSGGDGFGVEIDQLTLPFVRPLETGTVTNYGVASSIVHRPAEAVRGLWEAASLDLNDDSAADLLHPRFGFADAYNLDIADAQIPSIGASPTTGKDVSGPWANLTGFAIDHGPMLALIDNHLHRQFVPRLFMSYDTISAALDTLFPATPTSVDVQVKRGGKLNISSNRTIQLTLLTTSDFDASQVNVSSVVFAGAKARVGRFRDVDHDGDVDLVLEFRTRDTSLLGLYADAVVQDLLDGVLDSATQPVSAKLSGTTVLDKAFEGFATLDLFLPKGKLKKLFDSLL